MSFLVKTVFLCVLLFSMQTIRAENAISDYFSSLFSIEGGCEACVGSDRCHDDSKTCRRNCDVSLYPTEEKTQACKDDCVTSWASCMTAAKKNCKDYCPPE